MTEKLDSILPPEVATQMRPENIGYRLSLLRRALKLERHEIADQLGIERTYWSRFENGKRPVSDSVAALLVARYGASLDFLILGRWNSLPLELAERMREVERSGKDNPSK